MQTEEWGKDDFAEIKWANGWKVILVILEVIINVVIGAKFVAAGLNVFQAADLIGVCFFFFGNMTNGQSQKSLLGGSLDALRGKNRQTPQ